MPEVLLRDSHHRFEADWASGTVTPASGFFEFFLTAEGGFVMDIDTTTLPAGWTMSTDNTEASLFSGYGAVDSGNDFGAHNTSTDLLVSKTAAASACPGGPRLTV